MFDKECLIQKATLIKSMRTFLEKNDFAEILTPILIQNRDYPFDDHFCIEGKKTPLYLRICMEIRLRQLLLAGFKGVYEIGPCFRIESGMNESDSIRLNEFYMMECFRRDIVLEELLCLTEEICKTCAESINAQNKNFQNRWLRISVNKLISRKEIDEIRRISYNHQEFINLFEKKLNNKLYERNNSDNLYEKPFFLINFPAETICLAKRVKQDENLIERFELYINGVEVAHGFTDSIDYQDVSFRMEQLGWIDQNLLNLLKNNKLPHSGGVGIGIERLFSTLTTGKKDKYIVPEYL